MSGYPDCGLYQNIDIHKYKGVIMTNNPSFGQQIKLAARYAFPHTIPIFAGF